MTNHQHIKTAEKFTHLMDDKFSFMGIRFGLDNIIGIYPGLGDFVSMVISLYMVWIGYQMKLPLSKLLQMIGNVFVDFVIGIPPIIGGAADLIFKANTRNLRILKEFDKEVDMDFVEGEIIE